MEKLEKRSSFWKYFLFVLLSVSIVACGKDDGGGGASGPTEDDEPGKEEPFVFTKLDKQIESAMAAYDIPGAAVAVTRNEKLVYLKSYGFADAEKRIPVDHKSLFRLASVSKPITLTGILKLIEEKKLSFSDKVFGEGSVFGDDYGPVPEGSEKDQITIRHLIEHKSGWKNNPDDPVFHYKTLSQAELIAEMLANYPLSSTPGTEESYMNFGYVLLGRVIEKISGKPYETYIREQFLAPAGITGMRIGGTTLAERYENEVKYYNFGDNEPYTHNIPRMDAAGGWIASAADLARFIARIDRNPRVSDYFAKRFEDDCGTYIAYESWVHNGSLPGTTTYMYRINNTYNMIFLSNARSFESEFWNDIMWKPAEIVKQNTKWPAAETDLFKEADL